MSTRSELLTVGAGRAATALLALVNVYAFSHLFPPEEYALFALLTAFSTLSGLVLVNPVGQWMTRHLHEWNDNGVLARRQSDHLRYLAPVSLLGGLLGGGWFFIARNQEVSSSLITGGVIAGHVYFLTAAESRSAALNSLGHRRSAVTWQLATNALGLTLAIILVQWQTTAAMWLLGLGTGAAIAFIGVNREMARVNARRCKDECEDDSNFICSKELWRFAAPLTVVTALTWLEGNGFRFVLERAWDARDLGLYLMALSIPAQLTAIVESVVMQFLYPYFFRSLSKVDDKAGNAEVTSMMTNALLPLYLIWGGFLCIAAPLVLFLVVSPQYHASSQWMIFGSLMQVARLSGNVLRLTSQANKDFRPMLGPFAFGAMGVLAASFLTILTDASATFLAVAMVLALVAKNLLIARQARRMLSVHISKMKVFFGFCVLGVGWLGSQYLLVNRGAMISILILCMSGVVALGIFYTQFRTSRDLHQLLQQKLD